MLSKKIKILLFFCLFIVLPFHRGCDSISYGFPAVVTSEGFPVLYWDSLIVNVVCVLLFSWLFFRLYLRHWDNKAYRVGVYFMLFYHCVFVAFMMAIIFGFESFDKGPASVVVLYLIAPNFLLSNMPFMSFLENVSFNPLHLSSDDFCMRLNYILAMGFHFVVGFYGAIMAKKIKKSGSLSENSV